MKRVPTLPAAPAEFVAFCDANPDLHELPADQASSAWNQLRNRAPDALNALYRELAAIQQGLCGYCEQRLVKSDGELVYADYQIEHVLPKSGSTGRALDWKNLMLACGGGSYKHHDDPSRYLSGRDNLSCGQAKADDVLPPGIDPRGFPWRERVVDIVSDGRMIPNESACRAVGIDPDSLEQYIETTLNLNAERLKRIRGEVYKNLVKWQVPILEEALEGNLSEEQKTTMRDLLVAARLQPDKHGALNRFWTTERACLPGADAWISTHPEYFGFDCAIESADSS